MHYGPGSEPVRRARMGLWQPCLRLAIQERLLTHRKRSRLIGRSGGLPSQRNGSESLEQRFKIGREPMSTLFGQRVEVSETTEREIDVAVRDIITKAFEQATAGHLLLARKTLTADQFPAIRSAARRPETVG